MPGGTGLPGPLTSRYDFYSALYHEFTHVLGFASSTLEDGIPYFGNAGDGSGEWATFDMFLVDGNNNGAVDSDYKLVDGIWDEASQGGSSMFFHGKNAVAANGGNLVNFYSPDPWDPGSSISHLDDNENNAFAGLVMLATTGEGLSAGDYSEIEVGMLTDLGYSPVPVPATVYLLFTGLSALVGLRSRCRSV